MSSLLVRHPRAYSTESILGYLLRVSEENGYESPQQVLRVAGIARGGSIGKSENLVKLARALNQSGADPSTILAAPLDREWLPGRESTAPAKCCPRCIADTGFIEAHWVLPLMIACSVHNTAAVTACPSCRRPLRWYRPGLLECGCGHRIASATPAPLSSCEWTLLDVLRNRMLNLPQGDDNPAKLPVESLTAMGLKTLIRTIETLARLQGASIQTPKREVLRLAARILTDWPRKFLAFLDPKNSASDFVEYRKHVNRIYTALCGWSDDQRENTAFIGSIIVEFALIRWGYRHSALPQYSDKLPTGHVDCSLVSRDASLIGKSETRGNGVGRMRRAQLDLRQTSPSLISGAFRAGEQVMSGAMAADYLGIPKQVLRVLTQDGVLAAQKSPNGGWGYHRADVDRFAEALLACSRENLRPNAGLSDAITLRAAMAWEDLSIPARVSLLRAVLAGELKVEGKSGNHLGDLHVSRQAIRAFALLASNAQEFRTALQVAKLVGCTEAAIPGLIRMGLLRGTTGMQGWIYEAESVETFRLKYRFLLDLAREERTTKDWLAKVCRVNRIGLLWTRSPRNAGKQPFIRAEDVEGLRSVVTRIRESRERRRVDADAAVGAASSAASH